MLFLSLPPVDTIPMRWSERNLSANIEHQLIYFRFMCRKGSRAMSHRRSLGTVRRTSRSLVVVNWIQFKQDVEVSLAREVNDLRQVHAEHGGFVEIILGENAEL